MAASGNKKRRIARIGNISSDQSSAKLDSDSGLVQADCSLVYNIMQSMDKAQSVLSYQPLQEFRPKQKSNRNNYADQDSSSKQNGKVSSSKRIKKYVPEKPHPLMAKCQKSMQYLQKNRSQPKPRAHVGIVPKLSQKPITSFQPTICSNHTVTHKIVGRRDISMKSDQNSKKSTCFPEINMLKKGESSHSVGDSCDSNLLRTESYSEKSKVISDTDSDNEFERFLQKHNPEKCVRKKTVKSNKNMKRKYKKLACRKKAAKITSKTLSDSEKSADGEEECNNLAKYDSKNVNSGEDFPSSKFRRIVDYENSDDSAVDTHVNDTGILNYDSSSCSEDETIVNKSLTNENVVNFDDLNRCVSPVEHGSATASSSNCEDILNSEELKLKCKMPCYVAIKRDALLDKKAAALYTSNSVKTNIETNSNSYGDEEDCIVILSDTSVNNFTSQNSVSDNITPTVEHGNSTREESSTTSKSTCFSERSINVHDKCGNELIFSSNILKPLTETNLNEKSAEILKNVISTKCEGESTSVVNPISPLILDLNNRETSVSLNYDPAACTTEKETFNVQILSVKSLDKSDLIILSDDEEEEKNEKPVLIKNETKENETEDSDVEIICLDTVIVNKEKSGNESVKDVLNNETHSKANGGIEENLPSSSAQPLVCIDDDCIILDDLDLPNDSTCTTKNAGKVQQSSQIFDESNNEAVLCNKLDSVKDAILKTLETIDINCINKVIKESIYTQNKDIPIKVESSLRDNIGNSEGKPCSIHEKLKQSQNARLPQKQNIDKPNSTPVDTRQNSNVLHNFNSGSENVPSSIQLNRAPSSSDKSSAVSVNSSTNLAKPKSVDSEKEIIASCHKTERSSLKNQQSLPVRSKVECCESPSGELNLVSVQYIHNLDKMERPSIQPLIELYKAEYERLMEIKSTEQNVAAGLKLLEDKQAKKLMAISASIKNIVKKDGRFQKINNEPKEEINKPSDLVSPPDVENEINKESKEEIKKPSDHVLPPDVDVEKDDRVKIFNQSVVEKTSELLKSSGSSSSEKVFNHLINSVCVECGNPAVAACSRCAEVFYCSEKCGIAYWNKCHGSTCQK